MSVCLNFEVWENLGSLSPVKSGKLYRAIRFPSVFGSCNWKMLLVKSWDHMDPFWKIYDSLSSKSYFYYHFPFFWFFTECSRDFCFYVKTIKFNRFHNGKTFLFHASFKLVSLKRKIKNISPCAIHSNNISETLILFEYFRNMYPCHWRLNRYFL